MALMLGVDTGGTYTDAVLIDEAADRLVAKAKALTTRPDLAGGVGAAIDAVLERAGVTGADVGLVSLSTTLATNALVEGQGGRVALVLAGFEAAQLARDGLSEALAGDPVIFVAGGHGPGGEPVAALDLGALERGLAALPEGVTGVAVAARFATRNPAHEIALRDRIREVTGLPVTCSHELSQGLGGPKRALTAVLNARLVGLIARLIEATERHLRLRGIAGRLMVVRGDGALIPAELAREKPIETILSGPAASIAGAGWLTGLKDALVSDIGGTTTDVCLLRDGRPAIDPGGARVGGFRTMVEAVAMRTSGLGGDSEVAMESGLEAGLRLGPRRAMPVSLLAVSHPDLVHGALDKALASPTPGEGAGRFAVPLWDAPPAGLDTRETAVISRLAAPVPLAQALGSRMEAAALMRLVRRGLVLIAGLTPSDAAHVLGLTDAWDGAAAEKALELFARQKAGNGKRLAATAAELAEMVRAQLLRQSEDCLLTAAFAEEGWPEPERFAAHPLTRAALDGGGALLRQSLSLGVPVVGLGASAGAWYPPLRARLGCEVALPEDGDVANAIGAVVGLVSARIEGTVTSPSEGAFIAHLPEGPRQFGSRDAALEVLEAGLSAVAEARARAAGVDAPQIAVTRDIAEAEIEGRPMFVEARISVSATGRPRLATEAAGT